MLKIDLNCPAEIRKLDLPANDHAACDVLLFNLTDRMINSCEFTLILQNAEGKETERLLWRAHDLDGHPHTAFAAVIPVEEGKKPEQAEVIVEKVWFGDNAVWRRSRDAMLEYESNAIPNGTKLERLRFVAGRDAVGYPEMKENYWLCVCGRPNPSEKQRCVRCRRSRDQVLTEFTEARVEQNAALDEQRRSLEAKAVREDTSRLQMEREQAWDKKRKKRRKAILCVGGGILACGIAVASVVYLVPHLRYTYAVREQESGAYSSAITSFQAMSGYRDSDERALQCRYELAKSEMDSEDPDTLLAAKNAFLELTDSFDDAAELAQEAEYHRAEILYNKGERGTARSIWALLGSYRDSSDWVDKCDYEDACSMMEAGAYPAARAEFLAMGDYADSPMMVKKCDYLAGMSALEKGNADRAIDFFSGILDYEDAADKLRAAYYLKGIYLQYADDGDLAEAGKTFLLAVPYEGAQDAANTCLYEAAGNAETSSDWATAADLYELIRDYSDAEDHFRACAYKAALEAMRDKEYVRASGYLAKLPDDYEDVLTERQECIYLPAAASLKSGDYQSAVDGFAQLNGYRDSASKLQAARYGLAEQKASAGDYAGAAELYEVLGSYKDSKKQLKAARYQAAKQLMTEEKWQEAADLFEVLDTYSDSEEKLQECRYHQAAALQAAGSYEEAKAIYEALGRYSDAATQAKACSYARAEALKEAGSREEAAAAFAEAAGYEDASDQSSAIWYELAQEAEADNRTLAAARYYTKAGYWKDAKAQATNCYDAVYADAAATVSDAMANGDYALAVTLLSHMDLTDLPDKYAELADTLLEANYQEAIRLYKDGKPYEAYPYFKAAEGYKGTATYLKHSCYRILGSWQTEDGRIYTFNSDYTCTLNGEALTFNVPNDYALETGADTGSLTRTHSIVRVDDQYLTLRDQRDGKNLVIVTTRMPEASADESAADPEEEATMTDLYLVEDDDATATDLTAGGI